MAHGTRLPRKASFPFPSPSPEQVHGLLNGLNVDRTDRLGFTHLILWQLSFMPSPAKLGTQRTWVPLI